MITDGWMRKGLIMRTNAIGAALAAMLLLGACDSGGGGLPLTEVPDAYAAAFCDPVVPCLGDFARLFVTDESCRAQFAGLLRNGVYEQWNEAIARGTVQYDPDAAQACVDGIAANGCNVMNLPGPEVCSIVLVGTIPMGSECVIDEECIGDAYCAVSDCPAAVGVCTMKSPGGGPCTAGNECLPGLECDTGASTCIAPTSNSGGSCEGATSGDCPLDEQCVGATDGVPGTCTNRASLQTAAEGAACQLDFSVLCQSGLSCAVTGIDIVMMAPELTCVSPVLSGGACNVSFPSMCPVGEYCDANPMMLMIDGFCVPIPGEGAPCATSLTGERCELGLICIRGEVDICRRPQANGAPCTDAGECLSGFCDGSVCAAPDICER